MTTALVLAALAPTNLLVGLLGIALVFVVLAILSIALRLARPKVADKPAAAPVAAPPAPASAVAAAPSPDVKLIGVEEKEAALIMAIVCDELQTPPEELYFRSIRRIDANAQ